MGFQFLGIGAAPNTSQYMGQSNLANFGPSPYSSSLASMIQNMSPITASAVKAGGVSAPSLDYNYSPYQAQDMSKTDLPQFDFERGLVNTQYNQEQQQGQDALDRQFAAMGGGPGNGAQAKQTENLATGIAQQKGQDLQNIAAQEAATRTGLQQQQQQEAFQSGEAGKQAGLSEAEQNAQMGLGAQEFNQQQGLGAQEFNTGQQMQAQEFNNQFNLGAQMGLANLNTGWDQAQAEANNNEFNKAMSQWQATHSGGLLGGGGFLGLGIGAT